MKKKIILLFCLIVLITGNIYLNISGRDMYNFFDIEAFSNPENPGAADDKLAIPMDCAYQMKIYVDEGRVETIFVPGKQGVCMGDPGACKPWDCAALPF